MRTPIYQHGEAVGRTQFTAPESFGRIGRQLPAGGRYRERDAFAVGKRSFAIELEAAARANRSRQIGDFVTLSLRFFADKARRLIAGLPAFSNLPFPQHKE